MPEKDFSSLPFVTRKMLAFEGAAAFDLEVVTASALAVAIEITGMTREGPFRYNFTTDGATAAQTTTFRIPDVPIFLTVKSAGVTASVNIVYAMVYVRANQTRLQLLCQGFLGQLHGINFPNQVPVAPLQTHGVLSASNGTDPAAGAQASLTVPANEYWLLKQLKVTLVTDATVVDRVMVINYRDPTAAIIKIVAPAVQTASTTVEYHLYEGAAAVASAVGLIQNMPLTIGILLAPGYILSTSVGNLQAGDNLGPIRAYYERFYSA